MKVKNSLNKYKNYLLDTRGGALLFVVVFGAISFAFIVTALSGYVMFQNRLAISRHNREMALQIAEAGVAYYRWHIYHDETDFQDGTATSGPYIHTYYDKNQKAIGQFSLDLTPPKLGSTVATIKSTGWLDVQEGSKRTIKARVGKPSLTDYSFLTNAEIWIGPNEIVHGKMHSNDSVRFDGTTDAVVSSRLAGYYCPPAQPDCSGSPWKGGVWGVGEPAVFFKYPSSLKDFTLINNKLDEIRTRAINIGVYLDDSPNRGWRIVFSTTTQSGEEVMQAQIYKVNICEGDGCSSNINKPNYCGDYKCQNCYNTSHKKPTAVQCCLDISDQTLYLTTTSPEIGYFYSEKTVWVEGVIKGSIVVGSNTDIVIKDNIIYSEKIEDNILGLVARENVLIPYKIRTDLEVNASMIAQDGA
ncbi:MAG: hypothetical protein Q7J14_01945, partial [Candidatus Magasanikbacteria bacterium]|nr:hypothetical protein [Candidatus Magasanikbacteria bacterium]